MTIGLRMYKNYAAFAIYVCSQELDVLLIKRQTPVAVVCLTMCCFNLLTVEELYRAHHHHVLCCICIYMLLTLNKKYLLTQYLLTYFQLKVMND